MRVALTSNGPDKILSFIYFLALLGFSVVMLALILDAVFAVSRKPRWHSAGFAIADGATEDRRKIDLPFVGTERRVAGDAAAAIVEAQTQKAA